MAKGKGKKLKKIARQSAKAMAQKAGGSKRSGRIAGRVAARSVGKGRAKRGSDEYKDARAIGTVAGAEAGVQQRAIKLGRGLGKRFGGPVARGKLIREAAKAGIEDQGKVSFYRKGGTSTRGTILRHNRNQ